MAITITREQTPELLGMTPAVQESIRASGGDPVAIAKGLPKATAYVRLGSLGFPLSRHLVIVWEVFPSEAAARERAQQPTLEKWTILPEPNVIRREQRASDGTVIASALVLPTFDQVMGTAVDLKPGATLLDVYNATRAAIYRVAKDWPEFAGAVEA